MDTKVISLSGCGRKIPAILHVASVPRALTSGSAGESLDSVQTTSETDIDPTPFVRN